MLITCLTIWTFKRNTVWSSELSLWQDVGRTSPNKARGYAWLGKVYLEAGDLLSAFRHLNRALELNSDNFQAHNKLGTIYLARNDIPQALHHYNESVKINPKYFQG